MRRAPRGAPSLVEPGPRGCRVCAANPPPAVLAPCCGGACARCRAPPKTTPVAATSVEGRQVSACALHPVCNCARCPVLGVAYVQHSTCPRCARCPQGSAGRPSSYSNSGGPFKPAGAAGGGFGAGRPAGAPSSAITAAPALPVMAVDDAARAAQAQAAGSRKKPVHTPSVHVPVMISALSVAAATTKRPVLVRCAGSAGVLRGAGGGGGRRQGSGGVLHSPGLVHVCFLGRTTRSSWLLGKRSATLACGLSWLQRWRRLTRRTSIGRRRGMRMTRRVRVVTVVRSLGSLIPRLARCSPLPAFTSFCPA